MGQLTLVPVSNERYEEGMLENCPEVGRIVGLDLRQWTGTECADFRDMRWDWRP